MLPTFQEIMLPLLKCFSDGKEHHRYHFTETLAKHFNIDLEKTDLPKFKNRIAWAFTFLKAGKILENSSRGVYKITDRGTHIISLNLTELTPHKIEELFPDVMQTRFWNPKLREDHEEAVVLLDASKSQTPEETINIAVDQIKEQTISDLEEYVQKITPRAFEFLVVKLLTAMGYGTEEFNRTTSYTNDAGIDGVIQSDVLGFETIYIQAKKYEGTVGRPDMQKFIGAMSGTTKGVFITTSTFANSVREYLKERQEKVILIDGEKMLELMYKYNLGLSVEKVYQTKKVDSDFFENIY